MILRRLARDVDDTVDLVETYSDKHYRLKQTNTGEIFGSAVTDIIEGYDENNIPYSRYTYEETDEIDEVEYDELEDAKEALERLGVE